MNTWKCSDSESKLSSPESNHVIFSQEMSLKGGVLD